MLWIASGLSWILGFCGFGIIRLVGVCGQFYGVLGCSGLVLGLLLVVGFVIGFVLGVDLVRGWSGF